AVGRGRGLAVARLVLAGRPAADQAARPVPRPSPVAEVRFGDLLQQRYVVLEVGQDLLPLLPGQRLAGARSTPDTARWLGECSGWAVTFSRGTCEMIPGRTPRKVQIASSVCAGASTRSR